MTATTAATATKKRCFGFIDMVESRYALASSLAKLPSYLLKALGYRE